MKQFREYTRKTLHGGSLCYLGNYRVEIPESAFEVATLKERLKTAQRATEWSTSQSLDWDFTSALGDTIGEKNESLYVKIHECRSKMLYAQMRPDHYWIVASERMFSIMQCTVAFCGSYDLRQLEDGVAQVIGRWGRYLLYVMKNSLAIRSWQMKNGRAWMNEDFENIILGCGSIHSNKPCQRIAIKNLG